VPKKGHKYLIEACKLLAERGNSFKCLIAGTGPLEAELKALVDQLGLGAQVEFLGMVPNDRLKAMYANRTVDLVVLPSIVDDHGEVEGIPVALMEAMSYGIPVISTNTGGIPELVADAGIIISQRDAHQLADAISAVKMDPEMSSQMQIRERQKITSSFNVETVAEEILKKISVVVNSEAAVKYR
jgi:glycosyltransferase involved in cell wall biosynthesis